MTKRYFAKCAAMLVLLSACTSLPERPTDEGVASDKVTYAETSFSAVQTNTQSTSTSVAATTITPKNEHANVAGQESQGAETPLQDFAFINSQGHLQLATLDGETRTVWDRSEVTGFTWALDGERLAFVAEGMLYVWSVVTDEVEVQQQQPHSVGDPSWSADGKHIAITVAETGTTDCSAEAPCSILLVDTQIRQTQKLGLGVNPVFAPLGSALLAGTLPPLSPQMHEGERSAPIIWPNYDTSPITIENATSTAAWTRTGWSADGQLAAANNALLSSNGTVIELLAEGASENGEQDSPVVANGIAPNGRYIALVTLTITTTDEGFVSSTTLSLLDRTTKQRRELWRYDH